MSASRPCAEGSRTLAQDPRTGATHTKLSVTRESLPCGALSLRHSALSRRHGGFSHDGVGPQGPASRQHWFSRSRSRRERSLSRFRTCPFASGDGMRGLAQPSPSPTEPGEPQRTQKAQKGLARSLAERVTQGHPEPESAPTTQRPSQSVQIRRRSDSAPPSPALRAAPPRHWIPRGTAAPLTPPLDPPSVQLRQRNDSPPPRHRNPPPPRHGIHNRYQSADAHPPFCAFCAFCGFSLARRP